MSTILWNTASSIALAIDYVVDGPYTEKFITILDGATARINANVHIKVINCIFSITEDVDLTNVDLDEGEDFSVLTTYYIYACKPLSGNTPVFKISLNSSYPLGWDATNCRKIGGLSTGMIATIVEVWDLRTAQYTITSPVILKNNLTVRNEANTIGVDLAFDDSASSITMRIPSAQWVKSIIPVDDLLPGLKQNSFALMEIITGYDPRLIILPGGNMGVGVFNPADFKLQVAGSIGPDVDDAYDLGSAAKRFDDVYATNGTIQTSDEKLKDKIAESGLGLDFIALLQPVSFKFKDIDIKEITGVKLSRRIKKIKRTFKKPVIEQIDGKYVQKFIDEEIEETIYEEVPLYNEAGEEIGVHKVPVYEEIDQTVIVQPAEKRTYSRTHYGLVAQDVKAVLDVLGIKTQDFAGYIYDAETDRHGLRMTEFLAPMIQAIKELKARLEKLES